MPTGLGKTVVFSSLPEAIGFKNRTLVLVHRDELADQAAHKLRKWNPTYAVGVEMGSRHCRPSDNVVVAGVDTLGRAGSTRLQGLDPREFDGVICDEAHHSVAPKYKRVFQHFGLLSEDLEKLLLGVTATPVRTDNQGLDQIYDEIVYDYPILRAIRDGWLSDIIGIRIGTNVDLDGVRANRGDFVESELQRAVDTDARNEIIVLQWLNHAANRSTIAFTVDIAHAVHLAEAFRRHGIAAESVWGNDPSRVDKLRAHRNGVLTVLCNCAVLTEGYDDWRIGCVIMARPTQSSLLFTQQAGRGIRIQDFPDGISLTEARGRGLTILKHNCILIDVVDNTKRHQLSTLSSLFGLPPMMDLAGRSISDAVDAVDAAMRKHPDADFRSLDSLDNIEAFAERVDLFKVSEPQEIIATSDFRWLKTPADSYLLLLPNDEKIHIYCDLLDKWHVVGAVNGNEVGALESSLTKAIQHAEAAVRYSGIELRQLLKRKGSDGNELPTQAQLNTIKRFTKHWEHPPDCGSMTKREASVFLGKLFTRAHQIRKQ